MIRSIKELNLSNFGDILEEISKDFSKELNKELAKENKYSMDYNIYEEDGYKHYEFMLPGFEKDDIRVELNHKNEVIVTTSKMKSSKNRQYIEKNVKDTKMFKIQLNPELVNDDIKTDFNNCILTLSFKPQNNPKIIKIN